MTRRLLAAPPLITGEDSHRDGEYHALAHVADTSGIRQATDDPAMAVAAARSLAWPASGSPVAGWPAMNRATIARMPGSPSSPPWKAGTTMTLPGSVQAGSVS